MAVIIIFLDILQLKINQNKNKSPKLKKQGANRINA